MDFGNIVNTDEVFHVRIKLPNGEDSGVVFNVVSSQSKRVIDAVRSVAKDRLKKEMDGVQVDNLDAFESVSRETFIACVDSWDWGEHTFKGVGAECDRASKALIHDDPDAFWISSQVKEAYSDIVNFTNLKYLSAQDT